MSVFDIPDKIRRRIARKPKSKIANAGRKSAAPENDESVRLNLGCGDKILSGYINVDVAPSRKGNNPDTICDIRNLSFADDHADEVMAIHVIEHFYQWEAQAVLAEWTRVLKPGGKLVLECPNILSAAESLLKGSDAARPGKEGKMSMWVLYGDPAWQDPLMCHKWGYTPKSLSDVLKEAGLDRVGQEPAQFKQREPRDMRMVGYKK